MSILTKEVISLLKQAEAKLRGRRLTDEETQEIVSHVRLMMSQTVRHASYRDYDMIEEHKQTIHGLLDDVEASFRYNRFSYEEAQEFQIRLNEIGMVLRSHVDPTPIET